MRAPSVCADGEFADAIAIFVRTRVSAKIFEQLLVIAMKIDNAIVFHFDCEWRVVQVAVFSAQVITDHTIDDEGAVRVRGRCKDFAAGKIAPFLRRDDAARFEPFQFRRKLSLKFGTTWCATSDAFRMTRAFDQTLTERINRTEVRTHS